MKWEYLTKRIQCGECACDETLDRLGLDGWELVAVYAIHQGVALIFKRQVQAQIERPILKLQSIATTHVRGVGLVKTIANPGPSLHDPLWRNIKSCIGSEVEIDGGRYVVTNLTFMGDIARSQEWGLSVRPIANVGG